MTSVRIVLNAEKMVVKEAQRTYTYLGLFGYTTDMVVCNRLFPKSIDDQYFAAWHEYRAAITYWLKNASPPSPSSMCPSSKKKWSASKCWAA